MLQPAPRKLLTTLVRGGVPHRLHRRCQGTKPARPRDVQARLRANRLLASIAQASLIAPLLIARLSHAFALRHSRSTVRVVTFKTSATSSVLNPPKNFISTIRLLRGSISPR